MPKPVPEPERSEGSVPCPKLSEAINKSVDGDSDEHMLSSVPLFFAARDGVGIMCEPRICVPTPAFVGGCMIGVVALRLDLHLSRCGHP
jgi:hypothetical protein